MPRGRGGGGGDRCGVAALASLNLKLWCGAEIPARKGFLGTPKLARELGSVSCYACVL